MFFDNALELDTHLVHGLVYVCLFISLVFRCASFLLGYTIYACIAWMDDFLLQALIIALGYFRL